MKRFDRAMEVLFFFVMLPLSGVGNLLNAAYCPGISTTVRSLYFVGTAVLLAAYVVMLATGTVKRWRANMGLEEKVAKAFNLAMVVGCGLCIAAAVGYFWLGI